jgi:RNA polymerase sigma-70 factor, ECF subfamily
MANEEKEVRGRGVNTNEEDQPKTSLTLLERVRSKDKEAWERLVSLYSPLVYYWCKLAKLRRVDAEDVAQEVFVAVARGLRNFHRNKEGDTFRGWLRTITTNKIRDHYSPAGGQGQGGTDAQKHMANLPAPDPIKQADADAEEAEKNILYHRAVELVELSFEPNSRRVFWLLIGGRTGKEVAAELDMSVRAVFVAKARILKRLREEFAGILDWDQGTHSGRPPGGTSHVG